MPFAYRRHYTLNVVSAKAEIQRLETMCGKNLDTRFRGMTVSFDW
jgi:hypothetical protein